jgi:single-stranded DNA-binding protein
VSDYSGKDEDTLWLTVLVWSSKQTETLGNLVKKGALLLVSGSSQSAPMSTVRDRRKPKLR